MAPEVKPTMVGFEWSETPPYVPTVPGDNGWCVRDAVCQLFGWPPGSENWSAFMEGVQGEDTPRLAEHLGLACFQIPQDWNELIQRLAHPGVVALPLKDGPPVTTCLVWRDDEENPSVLRLVELAAAWTPDRRMDARARPPSRRAGNRWRARPLRRAGGAGRGSRVSE